MSLEHVNMSVEEVCDFLKQRGVDSSIVDRFRSNKVDARCVPLLTDQHLTNLGLAALGDQLSLRSFFDCKAESTSSEACSSRKSRSTLLKKLLDDGRISGRPKLQDKVGDVRSRLKETTGRPKSSIKSITLGLRVGTESGKITQIKKPLGDKDVINIDVPYVDSYGDVLSQSVEALFPCGDNKKVGNAIDYEFSLVDADNAPILDNASHDCCLRSYMTTKKIKGMVRWHLLAKYNKVFEEVNKNMPCQASYENDQAVGNADPTLSSTIGPDGQEYHYLDLTLGGEVQLRTSTPMRADLVHTLPVSAGISNITDSQTTSTSYHASNLAFHSSLPENIEASSSVTDLVDTLPDIPNIIDIQKASSSSTASTLTVHSSLPENIMASSSETDVQEHTTYSVMTELRSNISSSEKGNILNVVRGSVLDGTFRAFARKTFQPEQRLSVKFMGEDGADSGGLQREFFTCALQEIQKLPIFHEGYLVLNCNALHEMQYFKAGRVIAYCVVHSSGCGTQILSTFLYNLLVDQEVHPGLEDMKDDSLKATVQKIHEAEDPDKFSEHCSNAWEYILLAGCASVAVFNKKNKLLQALYRFICVDRMQVAIDQFKRGLECLDVLQHMKMYPEALRDVFVPCVTDICVFTAATFDALFHVNFSEIGSNRRRAEEVTLSYWKDFLLDMEDEYNSTSAMPSDSYEEATQATKMGISYCDVLQLITGSRRVPITGFQQEPSICFNHEADMTEDKKHLAKHFVISTCAMQISLPFLKTYDEFKEQLLNTVKHLSTFTSS